MSVRSSDSSMSGWVRSSGLVILGEVVCWYGMMVTGFLTAVVGFWFICESRQYFSDEELDRLRGEMKELKAMQ